MQSQQWGVLRQAMHQAVQEIPRSAVVANSDMGVDSGRVTNGLPDGALHSQRKVNLGFRNGLAMVSLRGWAVNATGPVVQSGNISALAALDGVYTVTVQFDASTTRGLHFSGSACCTICCDSKNGSALQLQVANTSSPTGYTWQRTEVPTVNGNMVTATFVPDPIGATVTPDRLRFMYEGEPECILYNGVGGPDNDTAIAATPFDVSLAADGTPSLVPATPCGQMLPNGSCYLLPEPCTQFSNTTCPKDRCCWSPTINKGQCIDKGAQCPH